MGNIYSKLRDHIPSLQSAESKIVEITLPYNHIFELPWHFEGT